LKLQDFIGRGDFFEIIEIVWIKPCCHMVSLTMNMVF